jgi:hypothetical protein
VQVQVLLLLVCFLGGQVVAGQQEFEAVMVVSSGAK